MKLILALAGFLFLSLLTFGQTQEDTIVNFKAKEALTIDGKAEEQVWIEAQWYAIDQVWIPYNASMKNGDFEGRFKVAWDQDYLYVLVEVLDDSLSDDYDNPLEHWWDDDCLEIFIDENRSMGNHERTCNAFAYHVSLSFDAIDLDSYGNGINYRENLEVAMDTIAEDTYLWEFAIKMYNATFQPDSPEDSRVYLENGKLMGFAIAYCDNDESTSRENFIGSMEMIASQANDMYKNADHFGPMLLSEKVYAGTEYRQRGKMGLSVYPIPARKQLVISTSMKDRNIHTASILSMTGQVVRSFSFTGSTLSIDIESLKPGMYLLQLTGPGESSSQLIIKE